MHLFTKKNDKYATTYFKKSRKTVLFTLFNGTVADVNALRNYVFLYSIFM